jgi:hypothetical protein
MDISFQLIMCVSDMGNYTVTSCKIAKQGKHLFCTEEN